MIIKIFCFHKIKINNKLNKLIVNKYWILKQYKVLYVIYFYLNLSIKNF